MNEFSNRDIADYYNQTLNHYQHWWHLDEVQSVHYGYFDKTTRTFREALSRMNEIMTQVVIPVKDDIVLDAGCGVGGSLFYLAEKFGLSGTGLTLSEKQLEYAIKLNVKRKRKGQLTFLLKDYTNSQLPDESFSLVWALESITSASEKDKFAKEAFRLLKPGGKLIVADYYKTDIPDKKQLLDKWRKTWSMAPFVTSKEFVTIFENAGFKHLETRNITQNIMPSSKRMYRASLLGALPSILYNLTHTTSRFAKMHFLSGIYQHEALKKNLWEYHIHLFEAAKLNPRQEKYLKSSTVKS